MSDQLFEDATGGPLAHFGLSFANDAIKGMLAHAREYREAHFVRVKAAEVNEYSSDDRAMEAAFAEIAFSGVAVGALAPLAESLMHRAAQQYRAVRSAEPPKSLPDRLRASDDFFWDPSKRFSRSQDAWKDDLLQGFQQLLEALGVQSFLADYNWQPIEALFFYRNRALHEGYEWQQSTRDKAAMRIAKESWNAWFEITTTQLPSAVAEPWLIAITDRFIDDALTSIESLARLLRDVEKAL